MDCWSCGAETSLISSIALTRGNANVECSVSDFTGYPHLIGQIQMSLPGKIDMGPLKLRHSKTLARSYMSNGCAHCDALFGQHFEIHTRYDETPASEFLGQGSDGWDAMLDELLNSEDGHLFHF